MADYENVPGDQRFSTEKYFPAQQEWDNDQQSDIDLSDDGDQQTTDDETYPDNHENVDDGAIAGEKQADDDEESVDGQQKYSDKISKTDSQHLLNVLIPRYERARHQSYMQRPENRFKKDLTNVPAYQKNIVHFSKSKNSIPLYYREVGAALYGGDVELQTPMHIYDQTPFPAIIIDELKREGFKKPLPIWAISWVYILKGHNFMGISQDINGILAYVLPCLLFVSNMLTQRDKHKHNIRRSESIKPGPLAVVVTHSLMRAKKIQKKFRQFGDLLNITTHLVFGDIDVERSEHDPHIIGLEKNPDILIAVCGSKLSWLMIETRLHLNKCLFTVFDDATLLTGHSLTIRNVLGQVRPDGIAVMWNSMIFTKGYICYAQKAMYVARDHFKNGSEAARFFFRTCQPAAPKTVKHVYNINATTVSAEEHDEQFILTIQTILTASASLNKKPKILVFCNTPFKADLASAILEESGLLSQGFYTAMMDEIEDEDDTSAYTQEYMEHMYKGKFCNRGLVAALSHHQIWIATDKNPLAVLDFTGFDCIVHYDFPARPELYEKRATKLLEEVGEDATIYTLMRKSYNSKFSYFADFLITHNQYCPIALALRERDIRKLKLRGETPGIALKIREITSGTNLLPAKVTFAPKNSIQPPAMKDTKKDKTNKAKEGRDIPLTPTAQENQVQNCYTDSSIFPSQSQVPIVLMPNPLGAHMGSNPMYTYVPQQNFGSAAAFNQGDQRVTNPYLLQAGNMGQNIRQLPNQNNFNGPSNQINQGFGGHIPMQANNNVIQNNGQFVNQGNFNGNCGNGFNSNFANNGPNNYWNQGASENNPMQVQNNMMVQNNGQFSNQENFAGNDNGPNNNFGNNGPHNNFGNQGGGGHNQMQAVHIMGQNNGQFSNQANFPGIGHGPNNNFDNFGPSNNFGNNFPNNNFVINGPNNNFGNNVPSSTFGPNNNLSNNGPNNNFVNNWNQGGSHQMQAQNISSQNYGQFLNQGNLSGYGNGPNNIFGNNGPNNNFNNNNFGYNIPNNII